MLPTPQAKVSFNYLGQFDQMVGSSPLLGFAKESAGKHHSPLGWREHLLEVNGLIASGALQVNWTYSSNFHKRSTVEGLAQGFIQALKSLIDHCSAPEVGVAGNATCFYSLAHHLGNDQPFYAFQAVGLDGKSKPHNRCEDMAALY